MTFKVKLKIGFFKTQLYDLVISQGQMFWRPQEKSEAALLIKNSELESVCLIKKNGGETELEIVTSDAVYVGILVTGDDFSRLKQVLAKEFGNKFSFT